MKTHSSKRKHYAIISTMMMINTSLTALIESYGIESNIAH